MFSNISKLIITILFIILLMALIGLSIIAVFHIEVSKGLYSFLWIMIFTSLTGLSTAKYKNRQSIFIRKAQLTSFSKKNESYKYLKSGFYIEFIRITFILIGVLLFLIGPFIILIGFFASLKIYDLLKAVFIGIAITTLGLLLIKYTDSFFKKLKQ